MPTALLLHTFRPMEQRMVEHFYREIMLLSREGRVDGMAMTRQQRADRMQALADLLKPQGREPRKR